MGIFNFHNDNKGKEIKDEIKGLEQNIDINPKSTHHFSDNDKMFVGTCMAALKNEVYFINNQITHLIRKYSNKFHEVENPQYEMSYSDYRYMYEEFINLVLMKYMRQCHDTKRYYIKNKTNKFMNTRKKDNVVNIDFMPTLVYNSYLVSEVIDADEFKLIEDLINKSIQKISIYNHQVVHTEIKYYLQESNQKEISINDYKIMFNTQMYSTITNIMIHSNICKNVYFNEMVKMATLSEQKK